MSPRKSAKVAFASAVVLLLLCGAAALVAISRYSESAQWIDHTYDVKVASARVESTLAEAARDRLGYISAGDPTYLQNYQAAKKQVFDDLKHVNELTLDNPLQANNLNRLSNLVNQRIGLLQSSMDARASGQPDTALQTAVSVQNTGIATNIGHVILEIQNQENVLLEARKRASSRLFAYTLWIFAAMLVSAITLLWIHYRFLNDELGKREEAENGARRLSVQVLELQDEERRKFSRELHDGLGQNLAVAKMIALNLSEKRRDEETLPELVDLLDRSIQETRTISYLLHPPLLDELGIASAANWFLEGFAARSGIQISTNIADEIGRLPRPVELVLFRVLQESLTNVHRHAKSVRADVSLKVENGNAVLRVRDYGTGIPADKLDRFRSDGTQVGVGLTGMRERVREHGGQFEILSSKAGTEVVITVPLGSKGNWEREVATASGTD